MKIQYFHNNHTLGSGVAGEKEEEQKKQEEKEAYEMEVVDAIKH